MSEAKKIYFMRRSKNFLQNNKQLKQSFYVENKCALNCGLIATP